MIYLQAGEDIVEVDSWEKITSREKFSIDIDLKGQKLEKIIGYYELPDKMKCGLKKCHKPHYTGFLVLTNEGNETNIGNRCGKTFFDVDFKTMSTEFLRDLEYSKLKFQLTEAKKHVFSYWQKINALALGYQHVEWAIKLHLQINDSAVIGHTAYRLLRDMFASGSGNVMSTRPPTDDEIQLAQVAGRPVPRTIDVVVGFVDGIEFMSPDNNLQRLYYQDLRGTIQALQDCDLEKLSRTQMQPIARGLNSMDNNVAQLIQLRDLAREFFKQDNLAQLLEGMTRNPNISAADLRRYSDFLETLQ